MKISDSKLKGVVQELGCEFLLTLMSFEYGDTSKYQHARAYTDYPKMKVVISDQIPDDELKFTVKHHLSHIALSHLTRTDNVRGCFEISNSYTREDYETAKQAGIIDVHSGKFKEFRLQHAEDINLDGYDYDLLFSHTCKAELATKQCMKEDNSGAGSSDVSEKMKRVSEQLGKALATALSGGDDDNHKGISEKIFDQSALDVYGNDYEMDSINTPNPAEKIERREANDTFRVQEALKFILNKLKRMRYAEMTTINEELDRKRVSKKYRNSPFIINPRRELQVDTAKVCLYIDSSGSMPSVFFDTLLPLLYMHKDALDIDIKVFADSIRDYSDNLKRSHSLFGSNFGVGFGNGYQDFSQDISENQYTHVFMFTDTDTNSGISRLISDSTNRVKQLYIFSLAGVWTKDVRGDKRAEIVKIY